MSVDINSSNSSVITGLNNKVDLDLKNSDIEEKIMPIGSTYIQFSGSPDPATLFDGNWTNISNNFSGKFLRIEGDNASSFGSIQKGGLPNITGRFAVDPFIENGIGIHSCTGCFNTKVITPPVIDAFATYSSSGTNKTTTAGVLNASRSSSIYQDGITEVRPENITVRIWKRTA